MGTRFPLGQSLVNAATAGAVGTYLGQAGAQLQVGRGVAEHALLGDILPPPEQLQRAALLGSLLIALQGRQGGAGGAATQDRPPRAAKARGSVLRQRGMTRLAAACCVPANACRARLRPRAVAAPTWRSSWSARKHSLRLEASQARSRRRTLALSAMVDSSLKEGGDRGQGRGRLSSSRGPQQPRGVDSGHAAGAGRAASSAACTGLSVLRSGQRPLFDRRSTAGQRRLPHRVSSWVVRKTSESEAASPSTVSSPRASSRTCTSLVPAGSQE